MYVAKNIYFVSHSFVYMYLFGMNTLGVHIHT